MWLAALTGGTVLTCCSVRHHARCVQERDVKPQNVAATSAEVLEAQLCEPLGCPVGECTRRRAAPHARELQRIEAQSGACVFVFSVTF